MERAKYELVWKSKQYAVVSPAFHRHMDSIVSFLGEPCSVIDFGCGSGYILPALQELGFDPIGVDHAENCLQVPFDNFKQACLWEDLGITADAGICCDVMEHIPPSKVEAVFAQIMKCVPRCYFVIHMCADRLGSKLAGEQLHITLADADWWHVTASKYGNVSGFQSSGGKNWFTLTRNC